MLAEFGYLSLLLATALSWYKAPCLAGSEAGIAPLLGCAKPLALINAILLLTALLLLASCFGQDDFTVSYVAQHANSALPLGFKLAAVWGGHEGSMLFFVFALGLWGATGGPLLQAGRSADHSPGIGHHGADRRASRPLYPDLLQPV